MIVMYRYFPKEIIDASRAGIDDIPIKLCVGGIQVYRKKIPHNKILEHCQKLMWQALDALYDLEDETPKGETMEEYLNSILTSQSGYLGKSMTNRDVNAFVISKLREVIGIMNYMQK